jgi:hypothetical protein
MTTRIGTVDGIHDLEGEPVALAGRSVSDLAGPWALTDGDTVWRVGPDGTWTEVARLDGPETGTCLLPLDDGGVLVGTTGAHLRRVRADGVGDVPGFEDLPARRDWYTPWGEPPEVRSVAAADGVAYVNVHVGGIARSDDGGTTWAATPLDIHADVHQVLAVPGLVLAAAGEGGLLTSTDAGTTWTQDTAGLHAPYARAVAVAGDTVLLTASTGPRTRQAAVYRRPLAATGAPFERCADGLPEWFAGNIDTRCLAARGDQVVFGTADGTVHRSTDAGVTWEQVAAGLPRVTAVAV